MARPLVILFAAVLAACAGLPRDAVPPQVSVAGIEVRSLGLFEQRFDVGLRVVNPNDFDLTIEALEFDLEVNGRPFAKGQSRVPARIPARANSVMQVDAITQSTNLIGQIRTLPPDTLKIGVPYRIRGRVRTDRSPLWLHFDHAGTYGGERKSPEGQAI